MTAMKTLYLCYLGLREPLVQTQVLPYLREIAKDRVQVHLLTFEPPRDRWTPDERQRWRSRLQREGIRWGAAAYHRSPSVPATCVDMAVGAWTAWRLVRRHGIDVVHARSHVPLAMALLVKRLTGCRVIFDLRGLLADEYAAAGRWKERSLTFRVVKRLERAGLRRADRIVVLTNRLRQWLIDQEGIAPERIEAIPCCVDASRIAESPSALNGHATAPLEVIYAGSVTGLYQLEAMARFVGILGRRVPKVFFRILTRAPRAAVAECVRRAGLSDADCWIGAVEPDEVPAYLRRAHVGLSFRTVSFAQLGASPTKIAEYLAAGIPVVSNAGVGDLDEMIEPARVGVLVRSLDEGSYEDAARRLVELLGDPGLRDRCRLLAQTQFDLDRVGGMRYRRLYHKLSVGGRT